MRYLEKLIFFHYLLLLLLGIAVNVNAQSNVRLNNSEDSPKARIDSFLLKLPSKESLIDSAINHAPILKMQSFDLRLKELEIIFARKNWTKNIISGSASYNYGDNLIISESSGLGQLSTNSSANSHYSVGLSLKIPLTTFFDHQDLRKAKVEMEKSEMERLILVKSLREEVNTRYLNLINAYQKYQSLIEDFSSYEINLQNAEKDFLNSRISVQEVTSNKLAYSKAKLDLTDAKNNFFNSIWLLEEIIGFHLKF